MAEQNRIREEAGTENAPTALQQGFGDEKGQDITQDDEQDNKQKPEEAPSGTEKAKGEDKKEDKPAGGYDGIQVPERSRGWTVRITIHRATNLPMADVNTLSSDPYVVTQLYTDTPNRHKEDPPITMRTATIRKNVDPEWNMPWTLANIPSSGFKLKLRVYDEDPGDHDDRLGNVHIRVGQLSDNFQTIKEHGYKIEKRAGSKRAYFTRAMSMCFGVAKHMHGELYVSIEVLGRTPEDGQLGRIYTIGPCWWTRHFSPMLGRLANTQDSDAEKKENTGKNEKDSQTKRFNFQANQIQLTGPVPKELYHRFVEFKPWVQTMFTGSGIRGFFLSKALHHQHDRVYHFDRQTQWGQLPENPGNEMTKLFLDAVHYAEGSRIFTYVLTLDGLWRFTETGKEFGIDMLSKHTMHSDVGIYIAYSGEFFIRKAKHSEQSGSTGEASHPASAAMHSSEHESSQKSRPRAEYTLYIDNDSGTYRPNAKMLPVLKKFLSHNLPGLDIVTLDCQADEEKMQKLKNEQRERKKKENEGAVYLQGDDSSISSSDEEDIDAIQSGMAAEGDQHEPGVLKQAAKDFKLRNETKFSKFKQDYSGKRRDTGAVDEQNVPPTTTEPYTKS